jgi:lysozyme
MINDAGLTLIKDAEAGLGINARFPDGRFRYRTCYRCPAGVPTIGYGNISSVTDKDVDVKTITEQEANNLLLADLADVCAAVERLTAGYTLNDNQFGALCSLGFNIGTGAAGLAGSTTLRRIKQGDMAGAAEAILWWNKGTVNGVKVVLPGLAIRRAHEATLFQTPMRGGDGRSTGSTPVHENPPGTVQKLVKLALSRG